MKFINKKLGYPLILLLPLLFILPGIARASVFTENFESCSIGNADWPGCDGWVLGSGSSGYFDTVSSPVHSGSVSGAVDTQGAGGLNGYVYHSISTLSGSNYTFSGYFNVGSGHAAYTEITLNDGSQVACGIGVGGDGHVALVSPSVTGTTTVIYIVASGDADGAWHSFSVYLDNTHSRCTGSVDGGTVSSSLLQGASTTVSSIRASMYGCTGGGCGSFTPIRFDDLSIDTGTGGGSFDASTHIISFTPIASTTPITSPTTLGHSD